MNKPELLAPAGSLEKGRMALLYGADAVYLGGKAFGLRAFAANFSLEEIREIAGADSLGYLPLEDLHQLAPKAACGFCDGCFTERYPVDLE